MKNSEKITIQNQLEILKGSARLLDNKISEIRELYNNYKADYTNLLIKISEIEVEKEEVLNESSSVETNIRNDVPRC